MRNSLFQPLNQELLSHRPMGDHSSPDRGQGWRHMGSCEGDHTSCRKLTPGKRDGGRFHEPLERLFDIASIKSRTSLIGPPQDNRRGFKKSACSPASTERLSLALLSRFVLKKNVMPPPKCAPRRIWQRARLAPGLGRIRVTVADAAVLREVEGTPRSAMLVQVGR